MLYCVFFCPFSLKIDTFKWCWNLSAAYRKCYGTYQHNKHITAKQFDLRYLFKLKFPFTYHIWLYLHTLFAFNHKFHCTSCSICLSRIHANSTSEYTTKPAKIVLIWIRTNSLPPEYYRNIFAAIKMQLITATKFNINYKQNCNIYCYLKNSGGRK